MAADQKKSDTRDRGGIQSLERAFAILETIAAHPEGIALGDLAKAVSLHTSTTSHLTRTMLNLGYISQADGTKRYRIGKMVFAVAASARREVDLINAAAPILESLANTTGESSHLATLSGNEVTIIARAAGSSAFEMRERSGGVRPGHATAIGKALLAALKPQELAQYLQTHQLVACTSKTIVDEPRLMEELSKVRANGFAVDDQEFSDEVRCLAYPVTDFTGRTAAAIGVSGPVWRLSKNALLDLREKVEASAVHLSTELGSNNP